MDRLLDGLADGDGEDDGLLETDVDGVGEGDEDGLLDGDTLPSETTPAELPRHVPDTSDRSVTPSKAHLFVDCSHRQTHTARMRGYCMIARPLIQLPLYAT